MNKRKLQILLVIGILFVAYVLCLFLLSRNHEVSFWVSFAFICAGYLLTMFACFCAESTEKARVVGLPLRTMGIMYFGVEFVLGTVLMCFNTLSFSSVFVPQFILLALFLVVFVPTILARVPDTDGKENETKTEQPKEVVEKVEEEQKDKE